MLSSESQDLTLRLQETMRSRLQQYDTLAGTNTLLDATRYALARGGKMGRGRLLLEVCRAVGGSGE